MHSFGLQKPISGKNLGAKSKFWTLIIFFVVNMKLSVRILSNICSVRRKIAISSPAYFLKLRRCCLQPWTTTDLQSLDGTVAEVKVLNAGRSFRRGEVCSSQDRWAEVIAVDVELQGVTGQCARHGVQTTPWAVDDPTQRVAETRAWTITIASRVNRTRRLSACHRVEGKQQRQRRYCSQPRRSRRARFTYWWRHRRWRHKSKWWRNTMTLWC